MNAATLINQSSSDVEYYTDPIIIAAARAYLGDIDLDVASSARANERIQARSWWGIDPAGQLVDGLAQKWSGRVWMNHPFGRPEPACPPDCKRDHVHHSYPLHGNKAWVDKLTESVGEDVEAALCITYACTAERWFQPLLACPICFLSPRTNYYLPDGTVKKGVTKGSAIACLGKDLDLTRFVRLFRPFGQIKVNP